MKGYIDGINFVELESMKYWSFTASTPIEKRRMVIKDAIFSGDYFGALKVDGYYQRIVKDEDGNCFMIARSRNVKGEVVNKIDWVPQFNNWLDKLPRGTCLLCECYLPGHEGSNNITSILGCLKDKAIARQKDAPLNLYVFDIAAYQGRSLMKNPFIDRISILNGIKLVYSDPLVQYAEYYSGQELWTKLQAYLAAGREGMVIMKFDAPIYQKRTPARVSIKIKKELQETIDAIVLGATEPTRLYNGGEIENWKYWENYITHERLNGAYYAAKMRDNLPLDAVTKAYWHDWAGSLVIGLYDEKSNKLKPIGTLSGITEEILKNWQNYKGKVVEISGMELFRDENGKFSGIRHPRFVRFREDKNIRECGFSQVE